MDSSDTPSLEGGGTRGWLAKRRIGIKANLVDSPRHPVQNAQASVFSLASSTHRLVVLLRPPISINPSDTPVVVLPLLCMCALRASKQASQQGAHVLNGQGDRHPSRFNSGSVDSHTRIESSGCSIVGFERPRKQPRAMSTPASRSQRVALGSMGRGLLHEFVRSINAPWAGVVAWMGVRGRWSAGLHRLASHLGGRATPLAPSIGRCVRPKPSLPVGQNDEELVTPQVEVRPAAPCGVQCRWPP